MKAFDNGAKPEPIPNCRPGLIISGQFPYLPGLRFQVVLSPTIGLSPSLTTAGKGSFIRYEQGYSKPAIRFPIQSTLGIVFSVRTHS